MMVANINSGGSIKIYVDDVVVDNTQQRVILGNASTLGNSTVQHYQPATAWSATEITFTMNQGSFETDDQVYLFVVDSDGTASAGYAITIGGEGEPEEDTIAPTLSGQSPSNGSTNVSLDDDISIHAIDHESGVDLTSIELSVNGVDYTSDVDSSGTAAEYTFTLDNSYFASEMAYDASITWGFSCDDEDGNHVAEAYNFTCASEIVNTIFGATGTGKSVASATGSGKAKVYSN
jgi:hypothetical protein